MRQTIHWALVLFTCMLFFLPLAVISCRSGAEKAAPHPEIISVSSPQDHPPSRSEVRPSSIAQQPSQLQPSHEAEAERRLDDLIRRKGDEMEERRRVSMAIFGEAEALFHQYRYDEARDKLREALEVDPSNRAAQELLNRIGMLLGDTRTAVKVIQEDLADAASVRSQQARMEAIMFFNQGEKLFNENKFAEAIEKFERVLELIRGSPYDLGLAEIEQKAKDYIKAAEERQVQQEAELKKLRQQIAEEKARQEEEKRLKREKERAEALYDTALLLYQTHNFEKCEEYCRQILRFDPKNERAERLMYDAINARHEKIQKQIADERAFNHVDLRNLSNEAAIPYTDLLQWPSAEEWERIRKRQPAGMAIEEVEETPVIAELKRKVKDTPIQFEFARTPFKDVIEFIRRVTKISIVIDPAVLESGAGELPVNLKLAVVPVETALDIVIRKIAGLDYIYKEGYVYITTREEAAGEAFVRLYEVRDLLRPLPNFPGPSVFLPAGEEEGELGAAGIEYGFEEEVTAPITGEELLNLVRESIPGNWNGDFRVDLVGTGQLMVVNTRDIHDQVQKLLDSLRQFTGSMVHIESWFISVDDNFLQDIGVDIHSLGGQVGQAPPQMSPSGDDILNQVQSGFWRPIDQAGERLNINYRGVNIFERADPGDDVLPLARGAFSEAGGLALQVALLKEDAALNAILRAVEKAERAILVSALRLTVHNTQRANVAVLTQQAFIADLDVEIAEQAWIYDPVIQIMQYGIVLDVRPIISHDKKYITLEIQPSVSRLELIRNFDVRTGIWVAQPPRGIPLLQLPWVYFQRAQTTVRVPDRGTLIIGGMRDIWHSDARTETPFLGRIPILGFLFKREATARQRRNTIILVRATIHDVAEEEKLR